MNKSALVVGINKYDFINFRKLETLDVPALNAKKIASALDSKEKGSFEVKLLPEKERITLKELKDEIVNLFNPNGEPPETALFYFSGYVLTVIHGIQEVFLATSDSNPESDCLGVSLQWLKELLQESPVKKQIIILDCCHYEYKDLNLDKLLPGNQVGKDRFSIVAFDRDYNRYKFKESNTSCSILTTAILDGLKSQDDKEVNNDDLIDTLKKYEENLQTSGDFKRIYFGKSIVFVEDNKQFKSKSNSQMEFTLEISEYNNEILVEGSDKLYAGKLTFSQGESEKKDTSTDKQNDCPYKGLKYFEESDGKYFYGRDELTDQLIEKVLNCTFMAVMGASGSGKSSIIRAGLVYQLRKGIRVSGSNDWDIRILYPGKYPLESLAWKLVEQFNKEKQQSKFDEFIQLLEDKNAQGLTTIINKIISPINPKILLVVDQFEELFTLRDKKNLENIDVNSEIDQQTQFIECLLNALKQTENKFCLVLVIRADFFGKCAEQNSELAKKIEKHLVTITPMNEENLRLAISEPAKINGVKVDEELEDKLIHDFKDEAGSLALLQYALEKFWNQKLDNKLTLSKYSQSINLVGILEINANKVFNQVKELENGEEIARYIFRKLTHIGDGTGDSRKRVKKEEIYKTTRYDKPQIKKVLDCLEEGNLIVRFKQKQRNGQTIVYFNVIHDVLIRHWSRLRDIWLNDYRGTYKLKNNLRKDADDWIEYKNNDPARAKEYLITGKELEDAENFLRDYGDVLDSSEFKLLKNFIQESRKNSNLKKWRNGLIIFIISMAVVILCFLWQHNIRQEQNKLQSSQSVALARYSDVLFSQGQKFDALINGLRAAIPLQKKKLDISPEVTHALRQAIFGVKEHNSLEGHTRGVFSISFSDNGKILASGSVDKTIKLWNVKTGENTLTIKGHFGGVNSVCFNHDGQILASGSDDKTIKLWNPNTGEILKTLQGHQKGIIDLNFSPNGKILASGSYDKTIKLWDTDTGEVIKTLKGHNKRVKSISFSHDGQILASASYDSTIKLWDVNTGEEITTINAHKSKIYNLVFSHDGKTLASVSFDRTIKLWNIANPQEIKLIKSIADFGAPVYTVSFTPDDKTLAAAGLDNKIKLWEIKTGKEITTLKGHKHRIYHLSFSPDGKTLASASADNTIKLWDVKNRDITTLRQHNAKVFSVSFSGDGKTLASASDDKTIKLLDVSTGEVKFTLQGHEDRVQTISFSPDNKILASGSFDNTIRIWDVSTGKEIHQLEKHTDWINSVNFSPDGKTLATASDDKTIKIWDVNTGKEIQTLKGHEDRVNSASFSLDGKTLASGSFDNTIRIWNLTTGENTKTFTAHTDGVYDVKFSPDGKTLASASYDNTIKLWDVSTGTVKITLIGHTASVSSISFSPDGKILASASDDKTIKLWDVSTGEEKTTLPGHTLKVNNLSFSPDGTILASASDDRTVILWNLGSEDKREASWYLDVDQLTKRGCDRVSGYLQNNPNISDNDRHLCDWISSSQINGSQFSARVENLLNP